MRRVASADEATPRSEPARRTCAAHHAGPVGQARPMALKRGRSPGSCSKVIKSQRVRRYEKAIKEPLTNGTRMCMLAWAGRCGGCREDEQCKAGLRARR